jgi:hypothetical protein
MLHPRAGMSIDGLGIKDRRASMLLLCAARGGAGRGGAGWRARDGVRGMASIHFAMKFAGEIVKRGSGERGALGAFFPHAMVRRPRRSSTRGHHYAVFRPGCLTESTFHPSHYRSPIKVLTLARACRYSRSDSNISASTWAFFATVASELFAS